ncbi:MAG: ribosomal protein S18-alanine N-acetyltransferase [bacterium]
MTGVSIHKLTHNDLKKVLEIENLSFKDPWTKGMFEEEMKNGNFYVAKEGEKIIGYGGFSIVEDEVSLVNLAIHPLSRRRGIGSLLLLHLMEMAKVKKGKMMFLEVRRSNISAISFYHKHNFKETGVRKGYYEDREDAIVMACKL